MIATERESILRHPDVTIANVYEWITRHSAWSLPGGVYEGGRPMFTWVRCPSASHADSHPSAYLNHKKHWVECRACGFEGGIFAMIVGAGEAANFQDAAKWLEKQLGIKPQERARLDEQPTMRHFGERLPNERKTGVYSYLDLHHVRWYWINRYDGDPGPDGRTKRFSVHHQTPNGRYKGGYGPRGKIPYCLCDFPEAARRQRVMLMPEGEKCVDAVRDLGLLGTTIGFGANAKMLDEWVRYFQMLPAVLLLKDSDEEGRESAARRSEWLRRHGVFVRTVDLAPRRNDGYDVADWRTERKHVAPTLVRQELVESVLRPALR